MLERGLEMLRREKKGKLAGVKEAG